MGLFGVGCVAFSVYVLGPVSSPLGVSDLSLRHAAGEGFFARFEPGFRWCLAVLSPSPGGCRLGCVWARLRCVFCLGTGAFSSPLGVSDLSLRHAAGEKM